jgi:hypothetical protein
LAVLFVAVRLADVGETEPGELLFETFIDATMR